MYCHNLILLHTFVRLEFLSQKGCTSYRHSPQCPVRKQSSPNPRRVNQHDILSSPVKDPTRCPLHPVIVGLRVRMCHFTVAVNLTLWQIRERLVALLVNKLFKDEQVSPIHRIPSQVLPHGKVIDKECPQPQYDFQLPHPLDNMFVHKELSRMIGQLQKGSVR
jgi:hypothetical protein